MKRLDRIDFLAASAQGRLGWVVLLGVAAIAAFWPLLRG